jgi:hypothetical protein
MPAATASNGGYLTSGDWTTFNSKGSGTVTVFSVTGTSPVFSVSVTNATTTPTLNITTLSQSQNAVLVGPTSGSGNPTFRALTSGDLPATTVYSVVGTSGQITATGTNTVTVALANNTALPGNPTTTTQSAGDNSTKVATTAYVDGTYGVQYTTAANYTTSTTPTSTIASRNAPVNWVITAQAGALLFNAPTGSWADMQPLVTRISSGSSSYALTYNSAFTAGTSTPASATTANQSTLIIWLYNSSISKYQCYYSGTSN